MIVTETGEKLGSMEAEAEVVQDDDAVESEDLSKLLKADLVERAEAADIDPEGLTKADLIEALEEVAADGDDYVS